MTPRISVAITHAPWSGLRRALVIDQLRELQRPTATPLVSVEVVKDTDKSGVWPTTMRCLKDAYSRHSTHHLILQDDAVLCRDFVEVLHRVVAANPDVPMCFYCPRKVAEEARTAGKNWVAIDGGCWGICVLMPTPWVAEFMAWQEATFLPEFPHDDERLALWFLFTKRSVWQPVPSLVDHGASQDSLLGHSNASRKAKWFAGGADLSAVDWTNLSAVKQSLSFNSYSKKWAQWFKPGFLK